MLQLVGEYVQFQLTQSTVINGYQISQENTTPNPTPLNPSGSLMPMSWTLLGSNDNNIYYILDTQSNQLDYRLYNMYDVITSTPYQFYRFVIRSIVGKTMNLSSIVLLSSTANMTNLYFQDQTLVNQPRAIPLPVPTNYSLSTVPCQLSWSWKGVAGVSGITDTTQSDLNKPNPTAAGTFSGLVLSNGFVSSGGLGFTVATTYTPTSITLQSPTPNAIPPLIASSFTISTPATTTSQVFITSLSALTLYGTPSTVPLQSTPTVKQAFPWGQIIAIPNRNYKFVRIRDSNFNNYYLLNAPSSIQNCKDCYDTWLQQNSATTPVLYFQMPPDAFATSNDAIKPFVSITHLYIWCSVNSSKSTTNTTGVYPTLITTFPANDFCMALINDGGNLNVINIGSIFGNNTTATTLSVYHRLPDTNLTTYQPPFYPPIFTNQSVFNNDPDTNTVFSLVQNTAYTLDQMRQYFTEIYTTNRWLPVHSPLYTPIDNTTNKTIYTKNLHQISTQGNSNATITNKVATNPNISSSSIGISAFTNSIDYPDQSTYTSKPQETTITGGAIISTTKFARVVGNVGSFMFFSGFPIWNNNDGNLPRYGFPENELAGTSAKTNVSQLIYPMYNDTTIKNCFIFIEMNNIIETTLDNIA